MKTLTVFHDPRCALCRAFRQWLEGQPRHVELRFIDHAGAEAKEIFPNIDAMNADSDIIVMADDGAWWQGAAAWVTCLWTTHQYRALSQRMADPRWQPYVRRFVQAIAARRHGISKLLESGDATLHEQLRALPQEACGTETCQMPALAAAKINATI